MKNTDTPPPAGEPPALQSAGGAPAEALEQLRASAGRACALLKAMANEDRLLLLCQLADGPGTERNVGELQERTGIVQPTLSQQLGVLRDEGLAATRREGKFVYYRLAKPEVLAVMQALYAAFCGPDRTEPGDAGAHFPTPTEEAHP